MRIRYERFKLHFLNYLQSSTETKGQQKEKQTKV